MKAFEVLLILQPILTVYRLPVFSELATCRNVVVVSSSSDPKNGYGYANIADTSIKKHYIVKQADIFGGRLNYQVGLLNILRAVRPDKILLSANPRSISVWTVLIYARLFKIECYAHGQGIYRKGKSVKIWTKLVYKVLVYLSTKYICYTESVRKSLLPYTNGEKLEVASNSINVEPSIFPSEIRSNIRGVLFLGRLRCGSNVMLLIEAMDKLRTFSGFNDLELHLVGGGPIESALKLKFKDKSWIHWHGEIYLQSIIRSIASRCSVGCYPGNAGLSVVHFMALSLVPIVHSQMDKHMGPEPSYVVDHINGRLFDPADAERSLFDVLFDVFSNTKTMRDMQSAALATYIELTNPSLASRLESIIFQSGSK